MFFLSEKIKRLAFCGFVFVLILSSCTSAHIKFKTQNIEQIRRVFAVDDLESEEIFEKAHLWMIKTLYSTQGVILFEDKERGVLEGACSGSVAIIKYPGRMYHYEYRYILTIYCMDNLTEIVFSIISATSHGIGHAIETDLLTLAEQYGQSFRREENTRL